MPNLEVLARRAPIVAVILSGFITITIFPRLQLSWLAFVCFVPLLVLIPYHSPKRLLGYFFLSGVLFHIGNLYWIVHVIQHYSTLATPLAAAVVFLLCLIMSVFWAVFGWLLGWIQARSGFVVAMLVAPWLWILLEWTRGYTTHFPWCAMGYSQYNHLRIAQLASIFGLYGLSWLVISFNAAISLFIVLRKYYYIAAISVLLIAAAGYGHHRIRKPVGNEPVRVACIQGNVPQDVKHDYKFAEEVNQRHLELTKQIIQEREPDVVLWPEASTLFPLKTGGQWTAEILRLARNSQTPLLVGSDTFIDEEIFNSAFLIDANGRIGAQYDKMYLVPFGEFVPFKSLLFFAGKMVPEISDFSHGRSHTLFEIPGGKFAVHICFEVVFPSLSRTFTRRGATLLTTITNDAWFGKSAAPHQHFAMAVMRAIENRRYLIRSANTGISGVIDPYGRILQATNLFVPAKIAADVKWIDELTFYTKYGDTPLYMAIPICAFVIAFQFLSTHRHVERSAAFGRKKSHL